MDPIQQRPRSPLTKRYSHVTPAAVAATLGERRPERESSQMAQWAAHTDARGFVRVNLWRTLNDQTLASAACSTDPDRGGLWRRRSDNGTGNQTSHDDGPGDRRGITHTSRERARKRASERAGAPSEAQAQPRGESPRESTPAETAGASATPVAIECNATAGTPSTGDPFDPSSITGAADTWPLAVVSCRERRARLRVPGLRADLSECRPDQRLDRRRLSGPDGHSASAPRTRRTSSTSTATGRSTGRPQASCSRSTTTSPTRAST